jgi:hypothetical protein
LTHAATGTGGGKTGATPKRRETASLQQPGGGKAHDATANRRQNALHCNLVAPKRGLQQTGGKTRATLQPAIFFYFNLFNHILENESGQILFLNLSLLNHTSLIDTTYERVAPFALT